MPLPLGIFFILLSLYFLFQKKFQRSKAILVLALVWLFTFSYDPIANKMLFQIESSYPTLQRAPSDTQFIYLLGNGHTDDNTLPITSQLSNEAVVRLSEAIRLYQQLDSKPKIIVSGYSGTNSDIPHALMQNRLAQALGIPKEDLIVSSEPEDTEDEALSAKKRIGDKPFILVTSAYHMKRAMKWFRLQGLQPSPAPTFHRASKKNENYTEFLSPRALMKSHIVFHEILGMLWQKIKG